MPQVRVLLDKLQVISRWTWQLVLV